MNTLGIKKDVLTIEKYCWRCWSVWSSRVKTICELLNTKFGHLSGCLHNCCLFNTLYFFLKIPHQHGTSESNRSLRIPHSGSFRWSSPAAPPLWILSVQRVYPGISWSPCLGTCSSFWLSSLTPMLTSSCIPSFPICPWLTSVSTPSLSPRWIFRHTANPCPRQGV